MPFAMHGVYGARAFGWGGGFPFAIGGILLVVALLALAVTAIVALVRWSRRAAKTGSVEILRARFARGEITREQFEEMRRVLVE